MLSISSTLHRNLGQIVKPKLAPGMKNLGWSLATAIRERVRDRGELVDGPYKPKTKGWWVTTDYAVDAGVSGGEHIGDTGGIKVRLRDLKSRFSRSSFANTGGMWNRGLQVVPSGKRNVAIVFRGRSLGANIVWKPKKLNQKDGESDESFTRRRSSQQKRFETQHGQPRRATGIRVDNNLKAWVTLKEGGRHVLLISERERKSISNALVIIQRRALEKAFTGSTKWTMSLYADDRKLRAQLLSGEGIPPG